MFSSRWQRVLILVAIFLACLSFIIFFQNEVRDLRRNVVIERLKSRQEIEELQNQITELNRKHQYEKRVASDKFQNVTNFVVREYEKLSRNLDLTKQQVSSKSKEESLKGDSGKAMLKKLNNTVRSMDFRAKKNETFYRAELTQLERKILLRSSCLRLGMAGTILPRNKKGIDSFFRNVKLLFSDKYKFLVCEIPKCGCSSIKKLLLVTEGLVNVTDPQLVSSYDAHLIADQKLNLQKVENFSEISRRMDSYTKLIIVRDPFYRLLSAYRNKLEQEYPWSKDFAEKSRNIHSKFVNGDGKLATFSEFLSFTAEEENLDRHWDLYHRLCSPCSMTYDFIAHIETIEEDIAHFMDKLGIQNLKFPRNYKSTEQTDEERFGNYFKKVDKTVIRKVYEKYNADFELFGYKPHYRGISLH